MAKAKKDKIDKLVDKYKSANKAIEQRAAHARGESPLAKRRAANARKMPAKPTATGVSKPANKGLVKAGNKGVNSAASKAAERAVTTLATGPKLAARAGLVGLAGYAGYKTGQAINKKYNISGKIVDYLMKDKDKEALATPQRDKTKQSPTGSSKPATQPAKVVKTKGGNYPVYKKDSNEAKDFRTQFAAARKAGKKEFTWQGRKYNTKVK